MQKYKKESIYIIFSSIFFGSFIIFGVVYKAFAPTGVRGIVGGVQAKVAVKREIWKAYGWGLQIPDKGVEPFLSADSKSAGTPNGLELYLPPSGLAFSFQFVKNTTRMYNKH